MDDRVPTLRAVGKAGPLGAYSEHGGEDGLAEPATKKSD
jgi:hypothetical protein